MSTTNTAIYTGEDSEIVINLVDTNFADLVDVIAGVITNKVLRKTCKKSEADITKKVVAHATDPKKCLFRIFRDETATWEKGPMVFEITLVFSDPAFPDGKHVPFKQYICEFDTLETKSA